MKSLEGNIFQEAVIFGMDGYKKREKQTETQV